MKIGSRRRLIAATLVAAAAFVGAAASALASTAGVTIKDVDTSSFPVVSLTALVTGNAGASDITITEDGKPVDSPVVTALGSAGAQIDVVLVLDTSGSMVGSPLASAKEAAKAFISAAPAGVRIGLITFANAPRTAQPITPDHAAVSAAVAKAAAGGNTSLFDAIAAASHLFSGTDQRNIVLLTDGRDTASSATLRSAITAAGAAHATIYSIGLTTPETDVASLQQMATSTGGRYASADQGELSSVYQQILTVLTSQFRLTYESHAAQGTTATITVTALGSSATYHLEAPILPGPSPVPTSAPPHQFQPTPLARPALLSGTWGAVIVLGLTFLAVYVFAVIMLLPGVRIRRERDIARRVGVPAPNDPSLRPRSDRSIGAYLPTLVAMGDRLADAGGFTLGLEAKLERAGMPITAGELLSTAVLSTAVGGIVGGVVFRAWLVAAVFALVFALLPFVVVQVLANRRMKKLHQQLPDVLMILATSLRSGHSFLQALDTVSKEAADPGAKEFTRVVAEVRLGRPLEDALNGMADRVGSEDFRWAVLAVNIQREVGGNLAEVLDTVAETLRDRDTVRRQIDTLSAEGKLSLYVLMGLPILVGLWVFKFNREYISLLVHAPLGFAMLGASAVLMVIGYFWMRRIVAIDV